jgi:hypothetical protein
MESRGYFTVVTKSHLAFARVLMSQLYRFDPQGERFVFLVDLADDLPELADQSFRVVPLTEYLNASWLRRLSFQYSPFEFANACKAYAHLFLNQRVELTKWMYFDSDIFLTASPEPLFREDANAAVLLTPHTLSPARAAGIWPDETNLLRCGVYNGGWLLVRRSAEASAFIDWFVSRLAAFCFDGYRDTFVDQLWLNLAPIHFTGIHELRHPGVNVGYWNLHERPLEFSRDGSLNCFGELVYFLHFSGWDPVNPGRTSRHSRVQTDSVAWTTVAHAYSNDLIQAGLADYRRLGYSWDRFSDGTIIELYHRRKYYEEVMGGTWEEGRDPFESRVLLERSTTNTKPTFGGRMRDAYRRWLQTKS